MPQSVKQVAKGGTPDCQIWLKFCRESIKNSHRSKRWHIGKTQLADGIFSYFLKNMFGIGKMDIKNLQAIHSINRLFNIYC